MKPIPVPSEAARYGAAVLYLPDLWVDARAWRPWGGFLGHRGWEGWILPLRDLDAGIVERATAVASFIATLPAPPILLGEGAGAVVAAMVARRVAVAAAVLLAPIVPGASRVGSLLVRRDAWWPLLTGGRVPPPSGGALHAVLPMEGKGAEAVYQLAPDSGILLLDLARDRVKLGRLDVRSVVVAGAADALTPLAASQAFARMLGAEIEVCPGLPHALSTHPSWQTTAGWVHRWLVRGLDATKLEFYAEAMADRGDDGDD